jgi:hypothetical protein
MRKSLFLTDSETQLHILIEIDLYKGHRQKWLWVPAALDLPFRFSVFEPPYKNFSDLVKWRNNAIHHIPEFTKVVKYKSKEYEGTVSYAYSQFNLEHAKLAIKIVKDMV